MNFKDCLSSVPQDSGHDTFHDVFDISGTAQGAERMRELIAKYPVLTGMLDALDEQVRSDERQGASSEELANVTLGFGMALGTLALLAESEIPDAG